MRSCSRSMYQLDRGLQRLLVRPRLPAQLALGLRRAVGPELAGRHHLLRAQRGLARGRSAAGRPRPRPAPRGTFTRRVDPAQAPEVGEQAVEGEVAPAEDVALAHSAVLVGQQVARGHVADVDHVDRPVGVGRAPARAGSCGPAAWRSRAVSPGPNTPVGFTHTSGRPLRGQAQRLGLGLVHRVHVRDAQVPGGEELGLVGGRPPAVPGRARGAGGVAPPARPRRAGLLEHDARVPPTFTSNMRSASAGRTDVIAGRVEHPVDALHGAPDRAAVERCRTAPARRRGRRSPACRVSRTASRRSSPRSTSARRQVGADEAGRAGEQGLGHRARESTRAIEVGCRPDAAGRRRHGHHRVPAAGARGPAWARRWSRSTWSSAPTAP